VGSSAPVGGATFTSALGGLIREAFLGGKKKPSTPLESNFKALAKVSRAAKEVCFFYLVCLDLILVLFFFFVSMASC
jgi:hypothetical protein